MLIHQHNRSLPSPSEITSESTWLNRRQLFKTAGMIGAAGLILPPHLVHGQPAPRSVYPVAPERPDAPAYLRQKIAARNIARHCFNALRISHHLQ